MSESHIIKDKSESETGSRSRSLSTLTSYFTSIMSMGGRGFSILDKCDTTQIDKSLANRLKGADIQLEKLHNMRSHLQSTYDKAKIATRNLESRHKNNSDCINEKVSEIKLMIDNFKKSVADIDTGDTNEDTLRCVEAIFSFTDVLKGKLGGDTGIFKCIDINGVTTCTNYYRAVELNNTLLPEIKESRDRELPIRDKLDEVNVQINKIRKEIDLIKNFKIEHTKIITGVPNT